MTLGCLKGREFHVTLVIVVKINLSFLLGMGSGGDGRWSMRGHTRRVLCISWKQSKGFYSDCCV